MKVERGYANAREEPFPPAIPSDLHGFEQHAFLTRRCHDFRTMASIYMSHLYTRIPRYLTARGSVYPERRRERERMKRRKRRKEIEIGAIKSWEWKSIRRNADQASERHAETMPKSP